VHIYSQTWLPFYVHSHTSTSSAIYYTIASTSMHGWHMVVPLFVSWCQYFNLVAMSRSPHNPWKKSLMAKNFLQIYKINYGDCNCGCNYMRL